MVVPDKANGDRRNQSIACHKSLSERHPMVLVTDSQLFRPQSIPHLSLIGLQASLSFAGGLAESAICRHTCWENMRGRKSHRRCEREWPRRRSREAQPGVQRTSTQKPREGRQKTHLHLLLSLFQGDLPPPLSTPGSASELSQNSIVLAYSPCLCLPLQIPGLRPGLVSIALSALSSRISAALSERCKG